MNKRKDEVVMNDGTAKRFLNSSKRPFYFPQPSHSLEPFRFPSLSLHSLPLQRQPHPLRHPSSPPWPLFRPPPLLLPDASHPHQYPCHPWAHHPSQPPSGLCSGYSPPWPLFRPPPLLLPDASHPHQYP